MHCPFCKANETKVIDSRLADDGAQVRRRRECLQCGQRFTTFETAELTMPSVIKSDLRRSPFNKDKIRLGMTKALEKRPVPIAIVDESVNRIISNIRGLGEREIPSQAIGEIVMAELKAIDAVAYVRFASIYRSFKDINEFHDEIKKLKERVE